MHLGEDTLPLVGPEEEILVQEGGCTLERTLYLWWDLMRDLLLNYIHSEARRT